MASLHHLKFLKLLYNLVANKFVLTPTTMTLAIAILLLQNAQQIALVAELLSQLHVLRPIHVLSSAILLTATVTIYLIRRPRTVYLVDYTCFKPSSNLRFPKASFLEHAHLSPLLQDSTVNFIARVLEHSGMGEETCVPPAVSYVQPDCCLDEAHSEAELVVFPMIDDLLAKTCISLDVITNCSLFCPVPSITDRIMNRYKLRGDIPIINLSGMGCSAGVTAVGVARNILQVIPWGSHVLVVSTEILSPNHYAGNNRSMQLVNMLFRMGGTAKLLSTCRSKARFRLAHVVRTTTAADDSAYKCVYQEEDDEGKKGATLSKELTAIAGDALKAHITGIGPLVLPASELLKFLLFSMARKALRGRRRPYIPDFCMALSTFASTSVDRR